MRKLRGHADAAATMTQIWVGFSVGGVTYGIDIREVREILAPLDVVALPQCPPAVLGVAEHRGEVIAVLDLRLRFGMPRSLPTDPVKWVVVMSQDRHVALVVDHVTEVFRTNEEDGWNSTVPRLAESNRGIRSVYRKDESLVFGLETAVIVEPAQDVVVPSARDVLGGFDG